MATRTSRQGSGLRGKASAPASGTRAWVVVNGIVRLLSSRERNTAREGSLRDRHEWTLSIPPRAAGTVANARGICAVAALQEGLARTPFAMTRSCKWRNAPCVRRDAQRARDKIEVQELNDCGRGQALRLHGTNAKFPPWTRLSTRFRCVRNGRQTLRMDIHAPVFDPGLDTAFIFLKPHRNAHSPSVRCWILQADPRHVPR